MFLQSMREKTQSWVAYVIVGLLILSFAFWGISSYFGGGQAKGPVATVGGEDISYASYVSAYQSFFQTMQVQADHLNPAQQQYAKQVVLKNLIERLALIQYVQSHHFAVNQDQIDSALMSVPLFSQEGEFSPALFKRFLMANHTTAQQFIADFSTRMMLAQWDEGLRMSSFATPWELSNIMALLKQKRQVLYTILYATKTSAKADVSDVDVRHYYDEHQSDYIIPQKIKISYVDLNFSDITKSIKPTEKALRDYYTQNAVRYDKPEQWQVSVIHINSTASAQQVASDIAEAIEKKKDLNALPGVKLMPSTSLLTATNLTPALKSALKATAVGKTSLAVAVAKNQYVVYHVLSHQAASHQSYDEVKKSLKASFIAEEANKQWTKKLEEMADISYEYPDSLQPLAKHFDVSILRSSLFSQDYEGEKGVESNAEVVTAAFSDDVLNGGNNSDVIKLDHGKRAVVLRVSETVPAHEQAFKEVAKTIKINLIKQYATKALKEKAENIANALKNQQSLDKIQKDFGVIFSEVSVGRFSDALPSELLQQAFVSPLKQPQVVKTKDDGFSVMEVVSVIPGNISHISAKDRDMYKNVIMNEWAQAELSAYMQSIMANTKVKIHQQVDTLDV